MRTGGRKNSSKTKGKPKRQMDREQKTVGCREQEIASSVGKAQARE